MGKAAKRNLPKRMSLIDKFEAGKLSPKRDRFSSRLRSNFIIAASSGEVNGVESIHEDEAQIIVPIWYVAYIGINDDASKFGLIKKSI
jgi:hypothetical protein